VNANKQRQYGNTIHLQALETVLKFYEEISMDYSLMGFEKISNSFLTCYVKILNDKCTI